MGFLFWMFVIWFIAGRIARRRQRAHMWMMGPGVFWLMSDGRQRDPRMMQWRHPGMNSWGGGLSAGSPPRELTPRERSERAMADLRRRYVADEISVEEYEAGLDRVLRESPRV
jgi:hypothetical protein